MKKILYIIALLISTKTFTQLPSTVNKLLYKGFVTTRTPSPIEFLYGTYTGKVAALTATSGYRYKGMTVGIDSAGSVWEYQFKGSTSDADLVLKVNSYSASEADGRFVHITGNETINGNKYFGGGSLTSIDNLDLKSMLTNYNGFVGFNAFNSTLVPLTASDMQSRLGYLTNITGLVAAGANVTVAGSGTSGSPYVVGAVIPPLVDTIYNNGAADSLVYTIADRRHAVKYPSTYWTKTGNDINNDNSGMVNIGTVKSWWNVFDPNGFKLKVYGKQILVDSSGSTSLQLHNFDTTGSSQLIFSNGDKNCNSCRSNSISMSRAGTYPNKMVFSTWSSIWRWGGADFDFYIPSSVSGDTIVQVGLHRDFEIKGSNNKIIMHSPNATAHTITVTNTPAIALDGVEVTGTGGGGGTGTVTSVALTTPSWLSVGGSPVTSSGTLAVTATSGQTANQFLSTPNGSTGAVGLRSIVAADIPTLNQSTTGSAGSVTNALTIGAELSSTGATTYNGSAAKTIGIQSASVTNTMLAGSIAASKLVGSDIATVGTVSAGTWNGTAITGTYGGTGVNNGTKTITLGGNFATSGAFATTLTATGTTSVTLPTSGTLATRAGTETFTNKDLSSGTNTFPTTLATLTGTQTLTSKTLTSPAYTSQALTDGATVTWNAANGTVATVTLAGNRTLSITNPVTNTYYMIKIKQDGTGSRTLTFPTIKWKGGTAPTLTTTANAEDIITLFYDGTNYYGNWGADYK